MDYILSFMFIVQIWKQKLKQLVIFRRILQFVLILRHTEFPMWKPEDLSVPRQMCRPHTLFFPHPWRWGVSKGSTLHSSFSHKRRLPHNVAMQSQWEPPQWGGECAFFCNPPPQSWEANAMGTGNGTGQSISQSIDQVCSTRKSTGPNLRDLLFRN